MKINWFPGHMTKALREMAEEITKVDAVIYILDARAPLSCLNPELNKLIGSKPTLYVLNKSDLIESKDLDNWSKYFVSQNAKVISVDSTKSGSSKSVSMLLKNLCSVKIEKFAKKDINITIKAMVIGVPNCGKSTFINNLAGKSKTITGNKPGVTRGKQNINIGNGVEVLDTPGTLWPNLNNQIVARNLAFIGSISDNVVDKEELTIELIKFLSKNYKDNFENRYAFKIEDSQPIEIVEKIGISKHLLVKGNEIDYERVLYMILDDFRKGKLGKITLDKYV